MTATIIAFPTRKPDAECLSLVGAALKDAFPITSRDKELDMLIAIGGKLLDNLNDYTRPDCSGLMDYWIDRMDALDAKTAG